MFAMKWKMRVQEARGITSGNKPPIGTITIVFTDVQSSTSLWEFSPEDMCEALLIHNGTKITQTINKLNYSW
jgi:hypothetical protein